MEETKINMNIEQLKARGYDLINFIEQARQELLVINNEIAKLSNVPKSETKGEEVKAEKPIK